jgi:bile acid:Na+ symporter, BASS family
MRMVISGLITSILLLAWGSVAVAEEADRVRTGEQVYHHLSTIANRGGEELGLFRQLRERADDLDWSQAREVSFHGIIRRLEGTASGAAVESLHLVREDSGDVHVLVFPPDVRGREPAASSPYAGLVDLVGKKTVIAARVMTATVGGETYSFIQLTAAPKQLLLDRLFFVAIILLLFLTMVGMGLTLTVKDFALVFKKPAGMIIGPICQFGLLPLLAMLIGRLVGYYETYPFIFLGMILVASSPGGVTSNLMTYFGKGDLALSVSLTAVCTVLALFFTPFLLSIYGSNIPDFSIPVGDVFKQMLILVVVPLFVGMLIRWKAEKLAKKGEKPFAIIGIFSLLFLIIVAILGNLDKFADTERYGVKFYAIVFLLTFVGMISAGFLSKLFRIKNFQVRAISLECGLRNASLAMTIAILIQDRMGDFYSSMLFTAGIFGLWMYIAGVITIYIFPKWLPVTKEDLIELRRAKGLPVEEAKTE